MEESAIRYHWIRRVSFSGGFLANVDLDLAPGLNCLIGGRGTGKSTVLEAIRFALDRMPDLARAREHHRRIERMLESNLGSVRVELDTGVDGQRTLERSVGGPPVLLDERGKPSSLVLGRDLLFPIQVFSQNEIEAIAEDPYLQLRLIDDRVPEIRPLEDELAVVEGHLRQTAGEIVRVRRSVADLTQETRELPGLLTRIAGLEVQGGDERAERLRREEEAKALRDREGRALERIGAAEARGAEAIREAAEQIRAELSALLEEPLEGPNRELIERAREDARAALARVERSIVEAATALETARAQLAPLSAELSRRHFAAERIYEQVVAAAQDDPARARERARLSYRRDELLERKKLLDQGEARLKEALARRQSLRVRLSDLREERLRLRRKAAAEITEALSPAIRVRIEAQGNTREFAERLRSAVKGSKMKGGNLAEQALERGVPPSELLEIVERDDQAAMIRRLDVDGERASRLLVLLKEDEQVCALETVELHDLPVIELQDGETYKRVDVLSTGQKCTAILPILLGDSQRPLLVDQPEDNLDNAWIATLVKSVRAAQRQLLFVTHNPNLPVLGEAARVFVLSSTGKAATLEAAGDVDETREQIETILEGGREAFRVRMQRYGH